MTDGVDCAMLAPVSIEERVVSLFPLFGIVLVLGGLLIIEEQMPVGRGSGQRA